MMPFSFKQLFCLFSIAALAVGSGGEISFAEKPVMEGGIHESIVIEQFPSALPPDVVAGEIRDEDSLKPIPGVWITAPQLGLKTQTDNNGRFQFSRLPGGQFILSADKEGYLPQNGIMEIDGQPNEPFRFKLQKFQNAVLVDNVLHHLGDGSYSWFSAGASRFQQESEGIEFRQQFTIKPDLKKAMENPATRPYLQIGAVVGLDTAEAAQRGQTRMDLISAPPQVFLNGMELVPFRSNGTGQSIWVPKEALRLDGPNFLQIKSGYHRPRGRVDFDDFEFMNIVLRY